MARVIPRLAVALAVVVAVVLVLVLLGADRDSPASGTITDLDGDLHR